MGTGWLGGAALLESQIVMLFAAKLRQLKSLSLSLSLSFSLSLQT